MIKNELSTEFGYPVSEIILTGIGEYPPVNVYFGLDASDQIEYQDFKLRISYIPLIDTSLYSYNEQRFTDRFRTYRPYNQQANVISNEVLGELHEKVLRRGNGDSENISILHDKYTDAAPSGDKVGDYVITTREVEVNLYTTKITYTLNKYFAHLKKYAAILEEYRQYRIPNENIVRSQRTFHKFAKFGFSQNLDNTSIFDVGMYVSANEINLMKMNLYNIVLPAVSYNFNNTMVFEAEMESNRVAGRSIESFTDDYYKEIPVTYTDDNGMIETSTTFNFGRDFETFTDQDSLDLPKYLGDLNEEFYSESHLITKDAREQLAVSLQIHHMVEDEKIHLNEAFCRNNGLIGGRGLQNTDFQMAFLNIRPVNKRFLEASDTLEEPDILEEHYLEFYAYSSDGYIATTSHVNGSGQNAAS